MFDSDTDSLTLQWCTLFCKERKKERICVCVCVYVCVSEKEKDREGESERESAGERERAREREWTNPLTTGQTREQGHAPYWSHAIRAGTSLLTARTL